MKKLIINKLIGLFFFLLASFSFLSQLSYSINDSGFGRSSYSEETYNMMGLFGAHYSSFLFITLGISAYILTLFIAIHSFAFLIKKNNNYFLARLLLISVGIIFLSTCLELGGLNPSLLGSIMGELFDSQIKIYLENIFLLFCVGAIFWTISIYFVLLSFGFTNKNIFKILGVAKILITIFKVSFFWLIPFLKTYKKNKSAPRDVKKLTRNEPTILKNINKNIEKIKGTSSLRRYSELNKKNNKYELPPINLLKISDNKKISNKDLERRNKEKSVKLEEVLKEYGVDGKVVGYKSGPVVTLFEYVPAPGVKTSKIVGLSNDIARTMSSVSTRIASQPGKTAVGIEIPNQTRENVLLGDLISNSDFIKDSRGLTLALGKNISGEKKLTDLEKMPHLLIAGTTGSGKSVGINSMIISLLYRFTPSECKLILIDPKMLELSIYEDIPHLLTPVVTDPNKAVFALKWVVREMENRYRLMSSVNVKNINSFNTKIINSLSGGKKLFREVQTGIDKETRKPVIEKKEIPLEKIPLIVVVIDEMADLMMVAGKEVENLIQRLAQMARASGIHIIAATQRPSVDVITGTIKANFPSRISFRVASRFDSRTILNEMGAEQLLGSGDMLFLENGSSLTRLHGGFVSETEIEAIVNHIKHQTNTEQKKDISFEENDFKDQSSNVFGFENKDVDELYQKAVNLIIEQQKVSTSFIQRYLQIGYNRAARIVEKMEEDGIISEQTHAGKRIVLKKNI